jgi:hypothetical protein
MYSAEQSGEGKARPTALRRTVNGVAQTLVRPAGVAEDTGSEPHDACARRLPIDRANQGCWADKENWMNRRAGGERGPMPASIS